MVGQVAFRGVMQAAASGIGDEADVGAGFAAHREQASGTVPVLTRCRPPDGSPRTVGEHERGQPSQAGLVLVVVVVYLGPEVARRAIAGHHQGGGGGHGDERACCRAKAGGEPGASEVVVYEVHIPAKSELGRQEPEVVLAGDEVGSGRHMDQDVDVSRIHPASARAARPARSARSPSKRPPSARLCLRRPPNS